MGTALTPRIVVLVWVLWLGIDFFAHAGLFASVYEQESAFLLSREQLFVRIPLAYAAFFVYAGMTVWLVRTVGVSGPLQGARVALLLGGLVTVANGLAILSVSTISLALLAVWTFVQIAEFGVAGYVAVQVNRASARQGAVSTIGLALALVIGGVLVQNLP